MTIRPFPAHMYRVADPGDTRIAELEAVILELNDENAKLAAALLEEKKLRVTDRAEGLLDLLDTLAGAKS